LGRKSVGTANGFLVGEKIFVQKLSRYNSCVVCGAGGPGWARGRGAEMAVGTGKTAKVAKSKTL
jgi:hypothetical protein